MLHTIDTIREFKTANFRVVIDAVEEDCPDLSWDDTGEVREGIESGKFMIFCARARVFGPTGDEIASDYLGNCIYGSPAEFMDHRGLAAKSRADGCRYGSYFHDMVRTVCAEARKTICDLRAVKVRCTRGTPAAGM